MTPASVGFQCPDDVSAGNAGVRQPRRTTGLRLAGRRWGPVTLTLIGINVAMFLLTAVLTGIGGQDPLQNYRAELFQRLAQVPVFVEMGDWWRPFTAAFLHYGVFHLALNMVSLLIFGSELERLMGRVRYLTVYLVAVVGGAAAIQLLGQPFGQVAGASTAIYGLMGAFGVVLLHQKQDLRGLLTLLGINLVISFLPGVSLIGHLGGLVGGAAAATVLVLTRRSRPAAIGGTAALTAVLLVLVFAGIG
ncbi:rhomboid family intramembrane serine protease [Modestobacter versicolor]|uniref:Membrane associated rhomboid family serine protease n=1 Tax=Modestobacter versicolor TaxID=429133 RepID=A0A323VEZ1_9ACTN|nr:rhomboid family intramembrane serine protease [Modestobacter versicolor]MBB3677341.1 membrane associated rhomboid family serine protease [Modestobacter versicolor]PZA23307.1 rhomboid family intramembrane serine protease [Modestobacter versicolor]